MLHSKKKEPICEDTTMPHGKREEFNWEEAEISERDYLSAEGISLTDLLSGVELYLAVWENGNYDISTRDVQIDYIF